MEKNIDELHEIFIAAGRSGDAPNLYINDNSAYYDLAKELLRHSLPTGKDNRQNFLKGIILLENCIVLGSTSQVQAFMNRLDLFGDIELMDWMLANRNNSYVPFGLYCPLEVKNYSEYLEYEKNRQEHREKMITLDTERSRLAKDRKTRIREEHAARKKANDEKRNMKIKARNDRQKNYIL